jgi:hypothetical protein
MNWASDNLGKVVTGKRSCPEHLVVAGQQCEYALDDIGNRKTPGRGEDHEFIPDSEADPAIISIAHMKNSFKRVLILVVFNLLVAHELHASTVVYQTGFEAPDFRLGSLLGQCGWSSGSSCSQNAAQIISSSGGQAVQISGSLVASDGPNFYNCNFFKSLTNYNPVASGTPIVRVAADIWLNLGASASQSSWQYAFLILNDQNGNGYESIGLDKNGVVFGQNFASPDQIAGIGGTGTNGFHNLRVDLNFTSRTINYFVDGFSIGSTPFNATSSNLLGSVSLILQGGHPIDSTLVVDNLSVTASSVASISPCDLQITSAGPCLADSTPGIPRVGDAYGLKITVNVEGTPRQAFRIKWTIANVTYYFNDINVGAGNGYWWYFVWWVNLDDPIPWSVTLDPDGVSGDTNLVNNTVSGTFTPVPPAKAVELYSPRMMHGSETSNLGFQPGSGTIPNLYVIFGVPTSHGAQSVITVSGPTNSQYVVTPPSGVPVFAIVRTNAPASTFRDMSTFVAELSNIRVNPSLLRTVTWLDMNSLTTNWTQWLGPDPTCESTDPLIIVFVRQSLPANYKSVLTPYDTARTLHRAVMKSLRYQFPPAHGDAVSVLQDGVADCGGFSALLTACLRNVGIPARVIGGFWQGDSIWHARVEFHLPGVEWLVADPTGGNGSDPTGTYAYEFGYVPNANEFLAMDVGTSHLLLNMNFGLIQVPNWWWNGGATFNSCRAVSYLQPNGVLCLSNTAKNSIRFCVNDAPTEGSIVLQTSTNLSTWLPVGTNSANGSVVSFSFPTTNGVRRFYRVAVIP